MTQQEYENELKELKERLEKLEAAKIEELQLKRWKPNKYERYCRVNNCGDVCSTGWDNDRLDNFNYLIGNCFETEEEAEEYKKQIEYTVRYKNYIQEHSEPLDWNDACSYKYYAEFEYDENEINVDCYRTWKSQGTIYASSKQIIRDAIKEIGEDNFKKYVLGVK